MIFQWLDNLPDPRSLEIRSWIEATATYPAPLLITGETGTGKDFWAEYLAFLNPGKPFLNLNCGDVPETLLESEWFGFRKGAFTGADRDYPGKWIKGDGGIIFLNQIDLLPLHLQAKLLRIIERKRYFPLGSTEEIEINARFLFSADADIEQKTSAGLFRSDLFFRISTLKIALPPLRERPLDLFSLLGHFCREERVPIRLETRGRQLIGEYLWPGNIRELNNFVAAAAVRGTPVDDMAAERLHTDYRQILDQAVRREPSLAALEETYIRHLLGKHRHKTAVAKILGISRKSLYNKIKEYENH